MRRGKVTERDNRKPFHGRPSEHGRLSEVELHYIEQRLDEERFAIAMLRFISPPKGYPGALEKVQTEALAALEEAPDPIEPHPATFERYVKTANAVAETMDGRASVADLSWFHSVLYAIGPTEEFGSTELLQTGLSRTTWARIGSENRAFGFSVHMSCTRGAACTRVPHNVHEGREIAIDRSWRGRCHATLHAYAARAAVAFAEGRRRATA
jgi:hypothetical protein